MFDFPIDRLPLVPETVLRKHKVHQPHDTRFRACARLLQSIWREKQGLPIGYYRTQKGSRRKLGSRLSGLASATGANFLDADIRRLTRRELAYREPGAMIDEDRVWSNLLSSMPLGFNLLGPLKLKPERAERFVAALLPEYAGRVAHIAFEHSPARGDARYTADGTAFDAAIIVKRDDGARCFLGIELKYSEALAEPIARHRPRYDDLSAMSGLYNDPDAPELRRNPLEQLWREHLLAHSVVANGLFDAAALVLIAPGLNNDVQRGARLYSEHLAPAGPDTVPFLNVTLEDAVAALKVAGAASYADAFAERYLDFGPVHALI